MFNSMLTQLHSIPTSSALWLLSSSQKQWRRQRPQIWRTCLPSKTLVCRRPFKTISVIPCTFKKPAFWFIHRCLLWVSRPLCSRSFICTLDGLFLLHMCADYRPCMCTKHPEISSAGRLSYHSTGKELPLEKNWIKATLLSTSSLPALPASAPGFLCASLCWSQYSCGDSITVSKLFISFFKKG